MKALDRKLFGSVLILSLFLSMVACTPKADEKKTRVRPTGAITGQPINNTTQYQQQQYVANGTAITVNSINKVNSGQGWEVQTNVQLGNETRTIGTTHLMQDENFTTVNGVVGGYNVGVESLCEDAGCNWYYIVINVYQGQQLLYQTAILRDFQFGRDLYMVQPGNQPMNFDQLRMSLAQSY